MTVSAKTLSQRERVAAERPGEGLQSFKARMSGLHRSSASHIRSAPDFLDDPIEPLFNLIIGETEFYEAMDFDQLSPCEVTLDLIEVLPAIKLDGDAEIVATEVSDETGDRNLPSKFVPIKPAVSQLLPQHVFGGRALRTKFSSDFCQGLHIAVAIFLERYAYIKEIRLECEPSPRGRGWLRRSRVRGFNVDRCLNGSANFACAYRNPSPAASGGTLSQWERVKEYAA